MVMKTQTSALGLDHSELPSFPIICQLGLPVKHCRGDLCEWPPLRLYSAQPVQLYVAALLPGTSALLSSCPIPFFSCSCMFSPAFIFGPRGLPLAKLVAWFSCLSFLPLPTPH